MTSKGVSDAHYDFAHFIALLIQPFGVEHLRILLDVTHQQVKEARPQIFTPEFLRVQALRESSNTRDHLFISYSQEDTALAEWLTRKLTAERRRPAKVLAAQRLGRLQVSLGPKPDRVHGVSGRVHGHG